MPETNQQPQPPQLGPDEENPEEWVTYLQQMLNWFYQMQVVAQDGDFGRNTRHAVSHLRRQLRLSDEPVVDERLWKELENSGTASTGLRSGQGTTGHTGTGQSGTGHTGTDHTGGEHSGGDHSGEHAGTDHASGDHSGGGHPGDHSGNGAGSHAGHGEAVGEAVDQSVEFVSADQDTSWAAAIAMVATSNNNPQTLDAVLARSPESRRTATEARQIAAEHFGLTAQDCHVGEPGSWAGVLRAHGALWVESPTDEMHVFVVAGIRSVGGTVQVHVLDPRNGFDEWADFALFAESYGFHGGGTTQVLAGR